MLRKKKLSRASATSSCVCAHYNYSLVQSLSADPPLAAAAVARQPSEAELLTPCCANLQFSRPTASREPAVLLLRSPPTSTADAAGRSLTTTISSEATAAAAFGGCGGVVPAPEVDGAMSRTVVIAAVCFHCSRDGTRAASRTGYNYDVAIGRTTVHIRARCSTARLWVVVGGRR